MVKRIWVSLTLKADEAIFLGYFITSKTCSVFNKRTLTIEESRHVVFDEIMDLKENSLELNTPNAGDEEYLKEAFKEMYLNENPPSHHEDLVKIWRLPRGLSLDNIIGDISKGITTRNMTNFCMSVAFVS